MQRLLNCKNPLRVSEPWQYGQAFADVGDTPKTFWVEPFLPRGVPILHGTQQDQETNVFVKWLVFVTYIPRNGPTEQSSRRRIEEWVRTRNWHAMVNSPDTYSIESVSNAADPVRGVVMSGRREPGFRYKVEYSPGPKWTCTCAHFRMHREQCCKHINACIDKTLADTGSPMRLSWRLNATEFDYGNLGIKRYPGLNDIVEVVPPATQNIQNMFPVFRQWSDKKLFF